MRFVGKTMAMVALGAALAPAAAAQGIQGRVLDDAAGAPVAGATVTVLDGQDRAVSRARTDAAGAFAVRVRRAGYYRLRAERLGYRTVTSARLAAAPGEDIRLELRMSAQSVVLDPLTVVARPAPVTVRERRMEDFHWRRRQIPSGRFLGPEELARIRPFYATDALNQVPFVFVEGGVRRRVVLPQRFRTARGGGGGSLHGCAPTVYVNSVKYRMLGDESIDDLAPGTQLQGVEVYVHPAGAPAEFPPLDNPYCGVVVLWTRFPGS
ncbi:MAG TPA: carboxypeptidase-like regulatory domain-containing protein [Longimicrobium sp.]